MFVKKSMKNQKNVKIRNLLTCCLVSISHFKFGDDKDLAKSMHLSRPVQNGSSAGTSIGKHLFESKVLGKDPSLLQHFLAWFGVWVMSWSINCPICITNTVLTPSLRSWLAEVLVTVVLNFLADGRSNPFFAILGPATVPGAYSDSAIE